MMKRAKYIISVLAMMAMLTSAFVLPTRALTVTATPNTSTVSINGAPMSLQAYTINGNNYIKLRDLAYALSGTAKQFQVSYDGAKNQINLISNTVYSPVGGEMQVLNATQAADATWTSYTVCLDGVKRIVTTYAIGGFNYSKLRDLAEAINFSVMYQGGSGTVAIDTSTGYTKPPVNLGELKVSMIGDSVGAGVGPFLKKYLPMLDNNSKSCRQFHEAIAIAQQLIETNTLAPTVIIELGTNGTIKESDMRKLIDMLGSGRRIVFVNCQLPKSWGVSDNKTIAKVTADYPNTMIADWYGASLDKSGYFCADHVHPTITGAKVLAKVIADTVEKIQ